MYKTHIIIALTVALGVPVSSYWDMGTTTTRGVRTDDTPRTSFFRWQWVYSSYMAFWYYNWDWDEIGKRRRLRVVAGISIDLLPLSTAVILNRRVLITSYNYLDPYMNRMSEMRIWALGRAGLHNTPYRYRVYRVTRLIPLSVNAEHCHGPRCIHQPRHDVSIIISLDMIYIYESNRYHYAYRAFIPSHKYVLTSDLWMAGSGYEYLEHIYQNYKIFYHQFDKSMIVDCSVYLPKWWGKFICLKNTMGFPGVQNGGGLFSDTNVVGLGCFEIRYNEDRIFVFTDLRYYVSKIYYYADIYPASYYEYAYPQWSVRLGWFGDSSYNSPWMPSWQYQTDLYPLGKK